MDPVTLQVSLWSPREISEMLNGRSVHACFGPCILWIPPLPILKDARHSSGCRNVSPPDVSRGGAE